MHERVKYQNHLGEEIDFGRNGIYVKSSELHDYQWDVVQKNGKISGFRRAVVQKKLPVVIFCTTVDAGLAARNRLVEVAEKDILASQPGRLIIGDYYFKCYISKSQKDGYLFSRRKMEATLTITTDEPFWVREISYYFRDSGSGDAGSATAGFDYSFDYPVDYVCGFANGELTNPGFAAANFRMTIYGPCTNPTVYVGGHEYTVAATLAESEYLTIDSISKTIIKTAADGAKTNLFHHRGRSSYIFEKIPSGGNVLARNGDFNVDLVLLEERSEPKWT